MKYSKDGFSVEAAIEKGRELPEWYLDNPEVPDDWLNFLHIFNDLSSCRQIGMTLGPIPWDAILRYCQYKEYDEETTSLVMTVMKHLDMTFMDYQKKENAK
jgi:hypothetical protein